MESKRLLLDFLLTRPEKERVQVSSKDVDQDRRIVKVRFRRGSRPEGYDDEIPVHAPKDVAHGARLWVQLLVEEDLEQIVLECLEPTFATKEFLKLLDPKSFLDLAEAAIALTLGIDWRARFPELAKNLRTQV